MAVNQRVKDILELIKKDHNFDIYGFFDGKKDFDSYVYDLLKTSEEREEWEDENYLLVLRRYNSFTPALPRYKRKDEGKVKGGGYFLHWGGKGIAIDPGFDFIQNLAKAGLRIGNVDAVVLTHGHNDHYIDLDPILSLLYEFNELTDENLSGLSSLEKKDYSDALSHFKRAMEIDSSNEIAKKGFYVCLDDLGIRTELNRGTYETDLKRQHTLLMDIPSQDRYHKIDLFLGRSGQKTVDSFIPLRFDQIRNVYLLNLNPKAKETFPGYSFDLSLVPAKHPHFYSKSHSLGLKFDLKDEEDNSVLKLGITSDTGYYFANEELGSRMVYRGLASEFNDCNLLIAHIGSMLERELDWLDDSNYTDDESFPTYLYQKHLGLLGLVKLVAELDPDVLELVIISEYGEEMKEHREKLTGLLNSKDAFDNEPVFITGDIGLKVFLEDPVMVAVNDYQDKVGASDVEEEEKDGGIIYKEKP